MNYAGCEKKFDVKRYVRKQGAKAYPRKAQGPGAVHGLKA